MITLEKFVSDPQTQLQVVEYVEAAVCAGLPAQFAQICLQVREQLCQRQGPTPLTAVILVWLTAACRLTAVWQRQCDCMGTWPERAAACSRARSLQLAAVPPPLAPLQEVPVLVAQAAEQLQQALDPKDTCGVFGVCPGSAAQLLGLTAEQVCLLPNAA